MKTRVWGRAGVLSLLVAGSAFSVRGEVSAAPTKPWAGHVIAKMMQAWQAAHSNHFVMWEHTNTVTPTLTYVSRGKQTGDVSWDGVPTFQMAGPSYVMRKKPTGTVVKHYNEVQVTLPPLCNKQ